jgi:hypothetical protein
MRMRKTYYACLLFIFVLFIYSCSGYSEDGKQFSSNEITQKVILVLYGF